MISEFSLIRLGKAKQMAFFIVSPVARRDVEQLPAVSGLTISRFESACTLFNLVIRLNKVKQMAFFFIVSPVDRRDAEQLPAVCIFTIFCFDIEVLGHLSRCGDSFFFGHW